MAVDVDGAVGDTRAVHKGDDLGKVFGQARVWRVTYAHAA